MHLPNMLWSGLKRAGHIVVMIGATSSGGAVRTPYDRENLYTPRHLSTDPDDSDQSTPGANATV